MNKNELIENFLKTEEGQIFLKETSFILANDFLFKFDDILKKVILSSLTPSLSMRINNPEELYYIDFISNLQKDESFIDFCTYEVKKLIIEKLCEDISNIKKIHEE